MDKEEITPENQREKQEPSEELKKLFAEGRIVDPEIQERKRKLKNLKRKIRFFVKAGKFVDFFIPTLVAVYLLVTPSVELAALVFLETPLIIFCVLTLIEWVLRFLRLRPIYRGISKKKFDRKLDAKILEIEI